MEAIETLMAEHQQILGAIDALEAYAGQVIRGGGEPAELGHFVTFIREFADAHHHAKEENMLFKAMTEAGFSRDAGPVGVMLHEHDQGRALVGQLADVAQAPTPWSSHDRERLHAAALGYADLLRAHIQKEDGILYPMAEARLPDAAARLGRPGGGRARRQAGGGRCPPQARGAGRRAGGPARPGGRCVSRTAAASPPRAVLVSGRPMDSTAAPPGRLRPLLPREHGAWGQLAMPLLSGLLVGGATPASLLLAAATVLGFLAHEPWLVALGHRGVRAASQDGPRARRAMRRLLAGAAAAALAGAWLAPPAARWALLLPAALSAAVIGLVLARRERTVPGELTVVTAFATAGLVVALAAGAPPRVAAAIAATWALAFATSVLAVQVVLARAPAPASDRPRSAPRGGGGGDRPGRRLAGGPGRARLAGRCGGGADRGALAAGLPRPLRRAPAAHPRLGAGGLHHGHARGAGAGAARRVVSRPGARLVRLVRSV